MKNSEWVSISFITFERDVRKRQQNIERHGIDFEDAARIFEGPVLTVRSNRGNEKRFVALGILDDIEIAVVYTVRSKACRIISARRARQYERKAYYKALSGETEKGQD